MVGRAHQQGRRQHVRADEQRRDAVVVLREADDGLEHRDTQEHEHRGAERPRDPSADHEEHAEQRAGGHQVGGHGVDVREEVPVEVIPRGIGVAGVRAGAGDHHAQADRHGGEERDGGHHRAGGAGQGGELHRSGLAGAAVGPVHQKGREDHEGHGHEEVQAYDPRVQLGQHRDAADDGLRRDTREQAEGQQEEVAAFLAEVPEVDEHHHGDGGQRKRQEPVAEFDDAVDPISGVVARDPSVQRGQVGQPRPEAVNRTAPPVTTRTIWPTRDRRPAAGSSCRP